MRAKSASFREIYRSYSVRSGEMSSAMCCIASSLSASSKLKKSPLTRSSAAPANSSASTVLAKLGAAGFAAMASTSALPAVMAASKAGFQCSGRIRSKRGAPNGRVDGCSKGFSILQRYHFPTKNAIVASRRDFPGHTRAPFCAWDPFFSLPGHTRPYFCSRQKLKPKVGAEIGRNWRRQGF